MHSRHANNAIKSPSFEWRRMLGRSWRLLFMQLWDLLFLQ
jgi:hypothetical protein